MRVPVASKISTHRLHSLVHPYHFSLPRNRQARFCTLMNDEWLIVSTGFFLTFLFVNRISCIILTKIWNFFLFSDPIHICRVLKFVLISKDLGIPQFGTECALLIVKCCERSPYGESNGSWTCAHHYIHHGFDHCWRHYKNRIRKIRLHLAKLNIPSLFLPIQPLAAENPPYADSQPPFQSNAVNDPLSPDSNHRTIAVNW